MPDVEFNLQRADLLFVIPLPYRMVDGHYYFDKQSRSSLNRHLQTFERLIMALPLMAEEDVAKNPIFVWEPADDLLDRVQFVAMPRGGPLDFFRNYRKTAKLLRHCIDSADRLNFAIGGGGGLLNDWGQVAAEEAIKKGRSFSLQADWVTFGVYKVKASQLKGVKSTPAWVKLKLKEWLSRLWQARLVSRCDLMICNGRDVQLEYSKFCRSPEIAFKVHDFHIDPNKIMSAEGVEQKCEAVLSRRELRVTYAGRAVPMKGPLQWIDAIHEARRLGANIQATWLGDGPLLADMKAAIERLGLRDVIELRGFVSDREAVVQAIRDADVLMFTHLEPESPRILIEALISATPIVGYHRHYPEDLIATHQAGVLTPLADPQSLGKAIAELAADRPRLVDLIRRASREGARFNSDIMELERNQTMKAKIKPRPLAKERDLNLQPG
jgi:glycosyltransferase involved in cell wall biosynthesis